MNKGLKLFLTGMCVCGLSLPAQTEIKPSIEFNGYGSLEFGQIVAGKYKGKEMEHRVWLDKSIMQLGMAATMTPQFQIRLAGGAKIWFNTFPAQQNIDRTFSPFEKYVDFYIQECYGLFNPFAGKMQSPLALTFGVFPYKYNAQAKNLGEYLFRSGCYPGYLITDFDNAQATLAGLKLSSTLFGSLKQDLLFTTEREVLPLHDFSLSYIVGYTPVQLVEIGAGFQGYHIVSVDNELTTPEKTENLFLDADGDTGYYSFAGYKLMASLCLDPLFFLKKEGMFGKNTGILKNGLFGKEAGKLYAEIAVLGVKDYILQTDSLAFYDDIMKRMPIMFGWNIPIPFNILDVLAVQAEWYDSPYPNVYYRTYYGRGEFPVPERPTGDYTQHDYLHDNWKWSIFARKRFFKSLDIITQFSRDHSRHDIRFEIFQDREEIFTHPDHWYWIVKAAYSF